MELIIREGCNRFADQGCFFGPPHGNVRFEFVFKRKGGNAQTRHFHPHYPRKIGKGAPTAIRQLVGDVRQQFNLDAFPTMVILDASGKELQRQVGAFRTGVEFAGWLNNQR